MRIDAWRIEIGFQVSDGVPLIPVEPLDGHQLLGLNPQRVDGGCQLASGVGERVDTEQCPEECSRAEESGRRRDSVAGSSEHGTAAALGEGHCREYPSARGENSAPSARTGRRSAP